MCGSCASPWGACGCPTSDDYITQCGCSMGVYCAVCGHYPKSILTEQMTVENQKGSIELQKIFPPDPRYVLKHLKGAITMIEEELGYSAGEIILDLSVSPSVVVKFSKKENSK